MRWLSIAEVGEGVEVRLFLLLPNHLKFMHILDVSNMWDGFHFTRAFVCLGCVRARSAGLVLILL